MAYKYINALIDMVPEVTSPCWEAILRYAVFGTLGCFPVFSPHPSRKRSRVFYDKIHIFPNPLPLCHVAVSKRTGSALLFVLCGRFGAVSSCCPTADRQSPGFIPARSAGAFPSGRTPSSASRIMEARFSRGTQLLPDSATILVVLFSNSTPTFRPIPDQRHMHPGHCTIIIVICDCILHNINDLLAATSPCESKFSVPSNWLEFRRESGEEDKFCYFHILGAYWTRVEDEERTAWISTRSPGLAAARPARKASSYFVGLEPPQKSRCKRAGSSMVEWDGYRCVVISGASAIWVT